MLRWWCCPLYHYAALQLVVYGETTTSFILKTCLSLNRYKGVTLEAPFQNDKHLLVENATASTIKHTFNLFKLRISQTNPCVNCYYWNNIILERAYEYKQIWEFNSIVVCLTFTFFFFFFQDLSATSLLKDSEAFLKKKEFLEECPKKRSTMSD